MTKKLSPMVTEKQYALWVDSYCPRTLEECNSREEVGQSLKHLAQLRDIPHLIFHGPSGAGKQTRVRALLRAVYGDGASRMRSETITIQKSGYQFETMQSQFHTEVYASDLGFKDKQCIQLIVKNLASNLSAGTLLNAQKDKDCPKYRIFVVQEAHALSLPAQAALRRTMETYSNTARILLLTERLSGV